MSGATPPLTHYALTAWCSVKAQGQLYLYLLPVASIHDSYQISDFRFLLFRGAHHLDEMHTYKDKKVTR